VIFLHFNKGVKAVGLAVLRQVHKYSLGQSFEVVLNSVLHNIINVNDKLLELCQTLVNMMKVAIDVHRSPGKGNHTRSELVFKVLEMGDKQTLGVRSDLVDDPVVLSQNELKFVVIHLELVFLE